MSITWLTTQNEFSELYLVGFYETLALDPHKSWVPTLSTNHKKRRGRKMSPKKSQDISWRTMPLWRQGTGSKISLSPPNSMSQMDVQNYATGGKVFGWKKRKWNDRHEKQQQQKIIHPLKLRPQPTSLEIVSEERHEMLKRMVKKRGLSDRKNSPSCEALYLNKGP